MSEREEDWLTVKQATALGILVAGANQGIYFAECGGFIKIGIAHCVVHRVGRMKAGWPFDITPIGFIHEPDEKRLRVRERALHSLFSAERHRGEWFRDHPSLREFIAANCQRWPEAQ